MSVCLSVNLSVCLLSDESLPFNRSTNNRFRYVCLSVRLSVHPSVCLLSDESLALLPGYQQLVQVCLSVCLSV